MVDVIYKNNVLVKSDQTAVNLEQESYRRIEGLSRFTPDRKLGCSQIYNVSIRYIVVGTKDFTQHLNDVFNIEKSVIISTDTNRERILKEEKLQGLLPTSLESIFKIVYEVQTLMSKDDCDRICNC